MLSFVSGGMQSGTITRGSAPPPPAAASPVAAPVLVLPVVPSITPASALSSVAGRCCAISNESAEEVASIQSAEIGAIARDWAASLAINKTALNAATYASPATAAALATEATLATIAEAHGKAEEGPAANAVADESGSDPDASSKRQELAERFASYSALAGPAIPASTYTRGAIQARTRGQDLLKEPLEPQQFQGGDAAVTPQYDSSATRPSSQDAARQLMEQTHARAATGAVEKERDEENEVEVLGAPRTVAQVPPALAWPAPLKAWVAKCFCLCTTSLERGAMQRQVKDMVERAAEAGEIFTRDWSREPIPSRDTPKDRKRVMEGDRLKRDADERGVGMERKYRHRGVDCHERERDREDDRYYNDRRSSYDSRYGYVRRDRIRDRDREGERDRKQRRR